MSSTPTCNPPGRQWLVSTTTPVLTAVSDSGAILQMRSWSTKVRLRRHQGALGATRQMQLCRKALKRRPGACSLSQARACPRVQPEGCGARPWTALERANARAAPLQAVLKPRVPRVRNVGQRCSEPWATWVAGRDWMRMRGDTVGAGSTLQLMLTSTAHKCPACRCTHTNTICTTLQHRTAACLVLRADVGR